jgi:hypothetical protein
MTENLEICLTGHRRDHPERAEQRRARHLRGMLPPMTSLACD